MDDQRSEPQGEADEAVRDEVARLAAEGVRMAQTEGAEEAEAILRRALALAEERLGPDDAMTASCLNNLGELLGRRGRLDEAEALLRRAAAIPDEDGPPRDVATQLSNLALVLRRQERFAEAEPIYRRVLEILERRAAEEPDPDEAAETSAEAAGVLGNLAQVLAHTGRQEEAEPLMREVVSRFERHYGEDHPHLAIALNNLARHLEETGRLLEAEPLSRRHLEIFAGFRGPRGEGHALRNSAAFNYQDLLVRMGLDKEAAHARTVAVIGGHPLPPLPGPPPPPDFDHLSRRALRPDAEMEDKNALFVATLSLPVWLFLARGEGESVRPYVARNPSIAGGAPMVKAFTDGRRLQAFARENGLLEEDGAALVLELPTRGVLERAVEWADGGISHIHWNGDRSSDGYFLPLRQLPAVRDLLVREGLLAAPGDAK